MRRFIISRLGKGLTSFNEDNSANISGEKKSAMTLSRVYMAKKKLSVLVVILVFESKGLYKLKVAHIHGR